MKVRVKSAVCWMVLLSLVVGACAERSSTSGLRASPDLSEAQRRSAALVSVLQCLIDHRKIPDDHLVGQSWLRDGGHVSPDAQTVLWANEHAGTIYGGKTLLRWEDEATAMWPNWMCPFSGAGAS